MNDGFYKPVREAGPVTNNRFEIDIPAVDASTSKAANRPIAMRRSLILPREIKSG